MATADDWRRVRAELMSASDPMRSPRFDELYRLAWTDGLKLLAGFHQIARLDHQDLVHDVLMKAMPALLSDSTDKPRAYFLVALRNAATDALRRMKNTRLTEADQLAKSSGPETRSSDRAQVIDRQALLDAESPKNQQILVAVALGESREAIAKAMGTSRANVDQIVSRFRKRAKERGS